MPKKRKKNTKISFPLELLASSAKEEQPPLKLEQLVQGYPVWIVSNFFSSVECQKWIQFCEESGGLDYTALPATMYTAHRKCFRMQDKCNKNLADRLYLRLISSGIMNKLKTSLKPPKRKVANKFENPAGFNPNLRLYKYSSGHSFGKHIDESNIVESMGHTEITVLIYLSECKGGATRFYPTYDDEDSFYFDPVPGTMLLHVHGDDCLEHEADPVLEGLKYILRTDVVFASS
jgi:hypothetical protein